MTAAAIIVAAVGAYLLGRYDRRFMRRVAESIMPGTHLRDGAVDLMIVHTSVDIDHDGTRHVTISAEEPAWITAHLTATPEQHQPGQETP